MEAVRTAIIGINGFGSVHLEQIMRLAMAGKACLCAIVARHPERIQDKLELLKEHHVTIYDSIEKFFKAEAGGIDLLCVPTGIASHEELTVAGLRAGMNVLVEKPAAVSVASVKRMIQAEQESGTCFVAVGFQHLYAPEIQFIKHWLVSGRLGAVKHGYVYAVWPRNDQYYLRNRWAGRAFDDSGKPVLDSPANNALAHYLNLLLFFGGTDFAVPAEISEMEAELLRARKEIEMFDTCCLRMRTAADARLNVFFSHAGERAIEPVLVLECENGRVEWALNGRWRISDRHGAEMNGGKVNIRENELFDCICGYVRRRNGFICDLSLAQAHVHCIETLFKNFPIRNISALRRQSDGQYVIPDLDTRITEFLKS